MLNKLRDMKLKITRAKTKARRNASSIASTIPMGMAQLLGIEPGTILIWELNPETGRMEVFPDEN